VPPIFSTVSIRSIFLCLKNSRLKHFYKSSKCIKKAEKQV
jgi:hypothetical protein